MRNTTKTIDGCTPAQLKELLGLAAGSHRPLSANLPDRATLYRCLDELCGQNEPAGTVLLAEVCSPDASLPALEEIKELAKSLSTSAVSEPHRVAAALLYHAAVAAALARHGKNVSTRAPQTRLALYEDLALALGSDPLAGIFRDASRRVFGEGRFP
jgi:hypothetical protein